MTPKDFNLLVSTARGLENDACSEIWYLLGEIGDTGSVTEKTDISGLIVAKTVLDPFKVVEELRKMLNERPDEFRYTLKVVPIEAVVPTQLDNIRKATIALALKIERNETFRVTVVRRHTNLSTKEVIEATAKDITRKVDLHSPNKIVLIEVLGGLTGVSVIEPDDVLSVAKEKPVGFA